MLTHTAKIGNSSSPADGINGLIGSALQSIAIGAVPGWLRLSRGSELALLAGIGFESEEVPGFTLITGEVPLEASCHMREPLKPCQCMGPGLRIKEPCDGPPSRAG